MNCTPRSLLRSIAIAAAVFALPACALAQGGAPVMNAPEAETKSLFQYVTGGGVVGCVIIALSVAATALVIDLFLRLKRDRLFPESLVKHAMELAEQGRAAEILSMVKASDTMFARLVGGALERGRYGIDAVRQEIQQLGENEIRRLRTRVGHVAVIATAAPMLGLLGTVIGMVQSFSVLGESKNAARPDELAAGISLALITTCQGLILAIPLIFVHMVLRDRVSAVSQEAAHIAEKLLAMLATGSANRQRTAGQPQQQQQQPHPVPAPAAPSYAPVPQFAGAIGAPPIGMPPIGGTSGR